MALHKEPPIIKFGKHAGELLEDIPADYLVWLYENHSDLDNRTRIWIEERIDELRVQAEDEKRFRKWK